MIDKLIETLGLKWDIQINLMRENHGEDVADYMCDDESGHIITVYLPALAEDSRDLETIIAHELIHAWQEENGHADTHGASFKKAARRVAKKFNLPHVYLPDVDI
jgi:hypothetical protein